MLIPLIFLVGLALHLIASIIEASDAIVGKEDDKHE